MISHHSKKEEVKELLERLQLAHNWLRDHENHPKFMQQFNRSSLILKKLESLGIPTALSGKFLYHSNDISNYYMEILAL